MSWYKNPQQYTYCQSFRNLYCNHQNTQTNQQSSTTQRQLVKNTTLTLQYEAVQSQNQLFTIRNSSPQKLPISTLNKNHQFSLKNYSERLHSNNNKYSFSSFVKQSKYENCSRKSSSKSAFKPKDFYQLQKSINGVKQLNNQALKTFYKNFRKDPSLPIKKLGDSQTDRSMRIFSQRQMIGAKSSSIDNFINQSSKTSLENKMPQNEILDKSSEQKHFFKTTSYGKKFTAKPSSSQRQKQLAKTQRLKSSQNYCYLQIHSQQTHTQHHKNYLRGQKCLILNKDKNISKVYSNFKDLLLKDQQKRQSKKKQSKKQADIMKLLSKQQKYIPTFFGLSNNENEKNDKKYVSQMREKKKLRKNITSRARIEEQSLRNDIQPW